MRLSLKVVLSAMVLLQLGACTGTSELTSGNGLGGEGPGASGENTPGASVPPVSGALSVPREQVHLLPFRVRLAKVAAVLGVPTSDGALNDLRTNRLELGDYDYANGVNADSSWTSAKMSLWVRSLRPVCTSAAVKEKYPALPESLDTLILAAYGRNAEPADTALVNEALAGMTLDPDGKYLAVCLAVLSSAEFLTR